MKAQIIHISNNGDYEYLHRIPERKMWVEVINSAIHDIDFYTNGDYLTEDFYSQSVLCINALDAFNWIHGIKKTTDVLSFPWTCSELFPKCYKRVIDYYRNLTKDVVIKHPEEPKEDVPLESKYYNFRVIRYGSRPRYPKQLPPNLLPFSDDRVSSQNMPLVYKTDDRISDFASTANLVEVLERCNQQPSHNQCTPSYLPSILQRG